MELGTFKQRITHFVGLSYILIISSCGTINKGSLVIQEDIKPKVESTFQGLYAREDEHGAKRDRFILDLHYNDWVGDRAAINTGSRSIGFNFNALVDFPMNPKSTLSFATGLRFGTTRIEHNGLFFVDNNIPNSILLPTNDLDFPRKTQQFRQSHLEIPLEFRVRGEALHSFRMSLGASAGILLNSYEQWREGNQKYREYNHHNVSPYRLGAFMRLGYHRWSLFASYHFSPLFNGTLDSSLNQMQLGISVSIF